MTPSTDPSVGCPCSFRCATENGRRHPPIPRRHASMRAVGFWECSDKFDVGQGLRQRRVLAPLLFNIVFTAVLRVAGKRVLADAAVMDNMVQLQRKKGKGEKKGTSLTAKSTGGAERRRTRCRGCGLCCTLTMRASYCDHQKGWRG